MAISHPDIQGSSATSNMGGFDFSSTWQTIENPDLELGSTGRLQSPTMSNSDIQERIDRLEEIAERLENGEVDLVTAKRLREEADDHLEWLRTELDVENGSLVHTVGQKFVKISELGFSSDTCRGPRETGRQSGDERSGHL